MANETQIGLLELQKRIKESIKGTFVDCVWVRGEISEVKEHPSGHCYLTLIEKSEDGNGIQAKVSAVIWSSSYRMLKPYFESTAGQPLAVGMNLLVKVQVQYSEIYGLSLIICDIDPAFTVGEWEMLRQKTIARLRADGMFDMQATLFLPTLPRRFAVISSESAAGYRDFMRHLHENEYGYKFETTLFSAPMQGNEAPQGIIAALDEIAIQADRYDAVLILRGGGGAMDLVCFDDYDLAVNVAQFPMPVLTGIGHDHDYHVIDMVAHTNVKTPTALADYIIDIFAQEEYRIGSMALRLQMALKGRWQSMYDTLDRYLMRVRSAVSLRFLMENKKLDQIEFRVAAVDPHQVLLKGFALAFKQGRKVGSVEDLCPNDVVTLMLRDGIAECIVKSKNKTEDEAV
ncbi:MAG: exodeoxyribonuclease VII large subunit [Bacteroidales bacterium]|nr:exodeoxyribonuclease VII large subunit [Bacteroidales bacterium]